MTDFQLLHASKGYEIRFAEKHKLGSPGKISHESIILLNILIYTSQLEDLPWQTYLKSYQSFEKSRVS